VTLRWPHPIWWEVILAGARRTRAYRVGMLFGLISMALQLFLLKTVWEAVYGGRPSLDGIGQQQLLVYLTISTLQRVAMPNAISREIDDRVSTGQVAGDLVRPFPFMKQMVALQIGTNVGLAAWFVMAIPLAMLIGSLRMPEPANLGAYVVSFGLAYVIELLFWLLMGLTSFWLINGSGVRAVMGMTSGLLSGAVVPLWFMPDWMRAVVEVLPFQAATFLPASIFAGQVRGADLVKPLAVQAVWIVILLWIASIVWRRAQRKLVIQGG
jgi:ABC-type uncharacterized transport system permease subunit